MGSGEIYLRRKGIRPGKDIRERLETMTMEESAAYFRSSYGIELEQEDIIKEINSMIFDCYEKEIRIKPGLLPVLEDLKRQYSETQCQDVHRHFNGETTDRSSA